MITFVSFSLATLAVILAFLVAIFSVEVVSAAILSQRDCRMPPPRDSNRRVAVVVPAHNESVNLLPTLADIKAQLALATVCWWWQIIAQTTLQPWRRQQMPLSSSAMTQLERARDMPWISVFAISALDPPDVVIIIDADCRLADGTINRLAAACTMTHRPVQALDLMIAPVHSPINFKVAEFAWRVKNWVRPLGLRALGLPCQLMGTGMAFPWDLIRSAELANMLIMEDLKLGLDFALAGSSARLLSLPWGDQRISTDRRGRPKSTAALGARSHWGNRYHGTAFDFSGINTSKLESFGISARRSSSASFSALDARDTHIDDRGPCDHARRILDSRFD